MNFDLGLQHLVVISAIIMSVKWSLTSVASASRPGSISRRCFSAIPARLGGQSPAKPSLNVQVASGGPQAPSEYCASLVRKLDPEAWLCSYFWPRRERSWWLAWRAFNIELHLISTTVTVPGLAAIRYQFWRDTLSVIWTGKTAHGQVLAVPQHPIAIMLEQMKRSRPIQRYYLSQMIDVREKIQDQAASSSSLESHLATHGPLQSSLLLGSLPLLIPPNDPKTSELTHTLSHLSNLLTTASLIRNLPVLVKSKREINLPRDICAKHSIVDEEVIRQAGNAKGLKDACYEIGTRGMDELITARRDLKSSGGKIEPTAAFPVFLASVPAERYLKRLEKVDFNPFHRSLERHDWQLAPRIWWTAQTGKI
ncbi:Squalene/phytoene synthase-domain-containing protein [Kockovaella imperatae]|uniref:Squalene/phytoene synthase-domain-containing protein n=1 Tax=Kockovaella imperatae TaxID=4999 RepID=A0A1Y1UTF4_9TREE|nr:Squalene/phytoene synthase-domain-containing protein [Kockovaella imperatae]ORX40804.1 Squalene/phytoene synthase-domain-containing protein [Kockovaella imperatae]